MKNKLSIMLLLVTFITIAQNKFEPGYYIDNSGIKTECLIKNYDWKNNPKNIEFKLTNEDENIISKNIEEINEFALNGKSKFIKATVNIDDSSQNIITLSNSPNTRFVEKTVFLKVLVEGNSNLYYYENEDYERFFYSINDKIEQLVYKQYNTSEGNIATNESFKQQLFVNFKCNNDQKSIVALKYKNNDLIDYFIKTNNCITGKTESKAISEKAKSEIYFKVNVLLNNINTTFEGIFGYDIKNFKSANKNTFGFGFEAEIILPYNNKKWSLIFDPSYLQNKQSSIIYKPEFTKPDFVLYNDSYTIRIPLGIRRYFKLNESSKLFTNLSYSININKTYVYLYTPFDNHTNILTDAGFPSSNLALGFGYQYKKYSAEIKYNTSTQIYTYWSGDNYTLNQTSLKLGYKLF